MEFTKENWENAPEGARLEWSANITLWETVDFIGFTKNGVPVIEDHGQVRSTTRERLRIILPKRKVTVQLWHHRLSAEFWTLVGEHTFEVEGE